MKNLREKIEFLLSLYKSKNLEKAEKLNKKLLYEYPNEDFLYNTMGLIKSGLNKKNDAITYFENGIKIKPENAIIYNNLGSLYRSQDESKKSEECFLKSIDLDKKTPDPHNNLANLYVSLNRNEEAIESFKNALKINKNYFITHYNLGILYKNIGTFDKASKHLKEAIKIKKNFFPSHRALSQIVKYKEKNIYINELVDCFKNNKIDINNKTELSFTLGKIHNDLKEYDEAFFYYKNGNDLRKKVMDYSSKHTKNEFDQIKNIFSKQSTYTNTNSFNPSKAPIFIVGMPRSGTTLVEQIISSHPDVFGGDELNTLPSLINTNLLKSIDQDISVDNFINDKNKLLDVANKYIESIKSLSNNSKKVTDKLPINFKWIGLIKQILPNAKIINCTRNSRDICFSVYKNFFSNPKLNFAYDLDDIVSFYNLYVDLMSYWNNNYSNHIYNISYEKIISDSKSEISELLKFCDLQWNDKCLKFYKNKRAIKTASDIQARSKIYASSINSWKNYEKKLLPFFKNLNN